ncbi:LytTR family DNA-binding domain-containing protein [Olsenella sp. YH-ols2217]|uniref:LytTR family DNA-binding domain-containing protein n=1 Tax=Kribbibacterium absianum TaxID=3044210 RepID=A0ABT6ZJR3_9ACTN|nr:MULTISPECIES: LytTR family DNA-binding domain-containing protein [unclassified Olsenella]MDJ1122747.1 LytTR family DNA-binding domain-containing protein [Olsenella sp. YH-ols2216]MDJ1129270.1 LytTR family DNA-binding domain-containing protein [Olsenella sp. YH-ols2217]
MQVKLRVRPERREQVAQECARLGIEVADDADLVLCDRFDTHALLAKDGADTVVLPLDRIWCLETRGDDVVACTPQGVFKVEKRLYQLEALLPPDQFVRVSNCCIIARGSVERIRPGLSCRFLLTLKGGHQVDVTRTYSQRFKDFFEI